MKDEQTTIYLPRDIDRQVNEQAKNFRLSKNAMIRLLILQALGRVEDVHGILEGVKMMNK